MQRQQPRTSGEPMYSSTVMVSDELKKHRVVIEDKSVMPLSDFSAVVKQKTKMLSSWCIELDLVKKSKLFKLY